MLLNFLQLWQGFYLGEEIAYEDGASSYVRIEIEIPKNVDQISSFQTRSILNERRRKQEKGRERKSLESDAAWIFNREFTKQKLIGSRK